MIRENYIKKNKLNRDRIKYILFIIIKYKITYKCFRKKTKKRLKTQSKRIKKTEQNITNIFVNCCYLEVLKLFLLKLL